MLDNVNDFRKAALEISKEAAKEGKLGEKKLDIMQTMDRGYARMEELFLAQGSVIEDLTAVQKSLRGLPIVRLQLPTVVLVSNFCFYHRTNSWTEFRLVYFTSM